MKDTTLQNRSIYHDLLRILASWAVIFLHVCTESATWTYHQFSTPSSLLLIIFDACSRFAVPIFVMISGSFMIESFKGNNFSKLYSNKILRLVSAFVFWSAFYVSAVVVTKIMYHEPIDFKQTIADFIQGEGHLWFIPMIIFLYAITPLIKNMLIDQKHEKYFLVLAFIPIVIKTVHSFVNFDSTYRLFENAGMEFVSGYTVYYILGHYLTRYDIKKGYRFVIYALSAVSIVVTCFLSCKYYLSGKIHQPFVFDYLSLTVFIFSVAVFLLFKYGFSKINFKPKTVKFISKLSSLTFGIYLIHLIAIRKVSGTPLTVENVHPIISVPLITLIVFVSSAVITFIISKIPVLKKYII